MTGLQRVDTFITTFFNFTISTLRQVALDKPGYLKSTMEMVYEQLRSVPLKSFYGIDKFSFVVDQQLNDLKDFILQASIVDPSLCTLSMKSLIRLGLARGSLEDMMEALDKMESLCQNGMFDVFCINEELRCLNFEDGQIDEFKKELAKRKPIKSIRCFDFDKLKKEGYISSSLTITKGSMASDGTYLFLFIKDRCLVKIGTGN